MGGVTIRLYRQQHLRPDGSSPPNRQIIKRRTGRQNYPRAFFCFGSPVNLSNPVEIADRVGIAADNLVTADTAGRHEAAVPGRAAAAQRLPSDR